MPFYSAFGYIPTHVEKKILNNNIYLNEHYYSQKKYKKVRFVL